MKKAPLFVAALATLALASCTDEEPVSVNNGRAIDFRASMTTKSRATETTNANLDKIYVTGLVGNSPLFNQLLFAKETNGSFFVSDKTYYYPSDDTPVQFYAYAPSADEIGADVTITADQQSIDNYYTPELIADQQDIVVASASGTKSANETSGTPLEFKHILSQIELQAKTENQEYDYEITGIRIGRAETTGTYDMATGEWTMDDWHETGVWTSSTDPVKLTATPQNIMGKDGNAMFIPQKLTPWSPKDDPDNVAREAYLSVLIRITSKDGGAVVYPFPSDKTLDSTGQVRKYAWASIPIDTEWKAGEKYVYVLDFTDGAGNVDPDDPKPGTPVMDGVIKFTVNVEDWNSNTIDMPYKTTPIK